MGMNSVWHWLILLVVALLMFGGSGKISSIMGDVAKGIKSFKKGLSDDDEEKAAEAAKAEAARAEAAKKVIDASVAKPGETTKVG
jgi:sec-independent protein translocase protein TatA